MLSPMGKRALLVVEVLVIVGLAEFAAVQIGMGGFARLFGNLSSRSPESSPPASAAQAVPFAPANVRDLQDIPAGGTPDRSSVLVQRGVCSTQLAALVIDQIPAGSGAYRTSHIPAIAGMDLTHEEGVTLEADGLTIIGITADSRGFRAARRSAVGKADFAVVENDGFANIVGTAPQVLWAPSLSGDGLAFYYSIVNDADPNVRSMGFDRAAHDERSVSPRQAHAGDRPDPGSIRRRCVGGPPETVPRAERRRGRRRRNRRPVPAERGRTLQKPERARQPAAGSGAARPTAR